MPEPLKSQALVTKQQRLPITLQLTLNPHSAIKIVILDEGQPGSWYILGASPDGSI